MTFDEWNRAETKRLTEGEDRDVARLIRKARSGGFARFTLRGDYVKACRDAGVEPEAVVA